MERKFDDWNKKYIFIKNPNKSTKRNKNLKKEYFHYNK